MIDFAAADAAYIRNINASRFDEIALSLYSWQYDENLLYKAFSDSLRKNPGNVRSVTDIPYLPVSFFKTHKVISGNTERPPALLFESSTTTGDVPGRHMVINEQLYDESLMAGFQAFYGAPEDYAILALLPSYLERKTSSLVHMAKTLMTVSDHSANGFYLDEWEKLANTIQELETEGKQTILLGVTFALLDFAEQYKLALKHTIVMETGGMKGRREEWTRGQVHQYLKERWGLDKVHAEYGMTELLSQAYSKGDGIFRPSPTARILVRELNDPLTVHTSGNGCINVIDLANVYSCAFLATDDLGRLNADGSFEVLGRVDHSALRGCSLMVA